MSGVRVTGFPTFKMPACHRHFFKGHKWWCRGCDREAEGQFREVWWSVDRETSDALLAAHENERAAPSPEATQP